MGLKITGLNEFRERLERLRPEEVMARALAEQAQRMTARVRDGLSEPPGGAGHDEPWLRSGALRDSVSVEADGLQAAVGSSDPAAVSQELGTAHMPARPFLAPAAAGMGEEVARAVGAALAAALRGDSTDTSNTDADLSGGGSGSNNPLNRSGAGTPTFAINANATEVGGPLSATSGASLDRPTPNLLVGPGAPTDADLLHLTADDGTPGNNQAQNKQFKDVVRILGLSKSQARQLHDEITGEITTFKKFYKLVKICLISKYNR